MRDKQHDKNSGTQTEPDYEVTIPSRDELLGAVRDHPRPVSRADIIEHFGLTDERQHEGVRRRLRAMERDGQLVFTRNQCYGLPERMDLHKGRVIGHRDGFGFVKTDQEGPDLFLPHHQMQLTMHGDRVLVQPSGTDKKGRTEARLVRVVEPGKQEIVGRYFVESGVSLVVPDDSRINQDFIIPAEHVNGARQGQIVVAEILNRPTKRKSPIARVKEILGEHMAPGMEIEMAIREHDIPNEWPAQVLQEAEKIPAEVTESDKRGRVDLRRLPLVTIDGEDARDFDDAVYCQREGRNFRLWVAIADVSHYVRPGMALDKEAIERGNSVYFPDHVIPMLPEALSNGLCSLNPDVDRLCMVAEMVIGPRGKLHEHRFYPGVMRSQARLTYTKVAAMLDGDADMRERYQHVLPHIEQLHGLYRVLRQRREQRGAIDFETTETRFIFNAQRKIERIVPVRRNQAHMIIEECMIMTNVAAAKFVEEHQAEALFRIHDTPDEERLEGFRTVLAELGITMSGGDEPTPEDFSKVLEQVSERPDRELIQTMLLRSLQQAVYSVENRGHFGLALPAYAHFTSPIRRYPDLILHRVIKAQIQEKEPHMPGLAGAWHYSSEQLAELGPHCSSTERRADDATRQVDEWLKVEFMQDHVGEEFNGVISTVTNFGLFVRLDDLQIDGLVHISNLPQEYYHYDAARHLLMGERSRTVYRVGDKVKVKVAAANLDERKIDFDLAGLLESAPLPKAVKDRQAEKGGKGSKRKPSGGAKAKSGQRRKKSGGGQHNKGRNRKPADKKS